MAASQFENICFVVDASRSSARADLEPTRLDAVKESILEFMRQRKIMENDIQTFYALVVVGREIKPIFTFTDFATLDTFKTELEKIFPGGPSNIAEGMGFAIKLHIEDIRVSGTRIPKIVIIGDGHFTKSEHTTPEKMAKIAAGLGIKIDTIKIGSMNHAQELYNISQLTTGKFYEAPNNSQLVEIITTIAREFPGTSNSKPENFSKMLEKIAVPLKSDAEMRRDSQEIIARILNKNTYNKCGICFHIRDPVKKLDFSLSGRYCPSCGTGFHLHCINEWAESHGDHHVVRCPHCFYLLKIPVEIQQTALLHEEFKKERGEMVDRVQIEGYKVNQTHAKSLGELAVYSSCPVCNNIFSDADTVIMCGNPNCNAIYHEHCFKSIPNVPCKICGKILLTK